MNETDAAKKFSVIATRIPYIDRRSLSEAWFSALHLASDAPADGRAPNRRTDSPGIRTLPQPSLRGARGPAIDPTPVRRTPAAPSRSSIVRAEITLRRAYDARIAGEAREAFRRARSYPPFRTSLTFGVGRERVQLLLRRDGPTLHVVALCRPEIMETVRRALACADAHLRIRGEAVRASVDVVIAKETGG